MTHYAPEAESTPDPQPVDSNTRPELFTITFWLIAIARMVRGAAVGGTAVLGYSQGFEHLVDVPWDGLLTGCVIGAIMSLGASLGNQFIPNAAPPAVAALLSGPKR